MLQSKLRLRLRLMLGCREKSGSSRAISARTKQSKKGAGRATHPPDLVAASSGKGEMRTYKSARTIRMIKAGFVRSATYPTIRLLGCAVMSGELGSRLRSGHHHAGKQKKRTLEGPLCMSIWLA
jgi:hypothetical protein